MKHWTFEETTLLQGAYIGHPKLSIPKIAKKISKQLPTKTIKQIVSKCYTLNNTNKMFTPPPTQRDQMIWTDDARMDVISRLEERHDVPLHVACKQVAEELKLSVKQVYPMVKRMLNNGMYHELLLRIHCGGDDE